MKLRLESYASSILAFIIPLTVRAIPEILMGVYVIGFDPIGTYIPFTLRLMKGEIDFWHFIAAAPLIYVMLAQLTSLGIPLTLTLKIMPALLHGFLALAIYLYARKTLMWSHKKSLFTTLLATSYFVALRVSWDLLRNQLGLVFLFITLFLLSKSTENLSRFSLLSFMMILTVLTNQYVTVLMLVIVATMVLQAFFKKEYENAFKLTVACAPATLLFLLVIYANYKISPDPSLILAGLPGVTRTEFENWLSLFDSSSYGSIIIRIGLLIYFYLPLLPLAVMGTKLLKNSQLKTWTLWSLIATFTPLLWQFRWSLMLTYPITFYAVVALTNIQKSHYRKAISTALISIVTSLSVGFSVMPSETPFQYFVIFPHYIPSSMLQNTVPSEDCKDVENALNWTKNNMEEDSGLLVHMAFYGWASLYLDENQTIIPYGYGSPEKAAENAVQQGYRKVYLIWWINGKGWHGQPNVPESFKEVYRSNKIAIYVYANGM